MGRVCMNAVLMFLCDGIRFTEKIPIYFNANLKKSALVWICIVLVKFCCYFCFQGNRSFRKSVPCNWSSGYRWSTAMLLRYVICSQVNYLLHIFVSHLCLAL